MNRLFVLAFEMVLMVGLRRGLQTIQLMVQISLKKSSNRRDATNPKLFLNFMHDLGDSDTCGQLNVEEN